MGRMIPVGLTGGIACGKTAVARLLARKGAYLICADNAARAVLARGAAGWRQTVRAFGRGILTAAGEIDRRKLGAIVFADAKKRVKLEAIVHPLVRRRWRSELQRAVRERKVRVAVVDVPLLYEVNIAKLFDAVIVVAASRATQWARLRARGLARREAEARIAAQWPLQRKIDLADCVIWNDSSPALLRKQVNQIWKQIADGNVG